MSFLQQMNQRKAAAAAASASMNDETTTNNNTQEEDPFNPAETGDLDPSTRMADPAAKQGFKGNKYLEKEKMPWVEKYRPEDLSQVISHGPILQTIEKLIGTGGMPHLLLHGPAGTGKTSTALAIARRINGEANYKRMVLELNASDERGIDTVRDKIKEFASSRQIVPGGVKLVILDEADSMTRIAQLALRRVMEMYAKTTRFIIIANYVNKILPALQSRCTCFRFGPLDGASVLKHLNYVAGNENVEFTQGGLEHVIRLSKGDMRLCLNIMQACKASYGRIDESTIYQCTGAPHPDDIEKICKMLFSESFEVVHQQLLFIQREKGLSLIDIITNLHEMVLAMNIPDGILSFILLKLADIEKALTSGSHDKLQITAMIGVFQIAKVMLQQHPSAMQVEAK